MLGPVFCRAALQVGGYLWPAYQCFKDINHPERSSRERLRLWAVYWVMLACFSAAQPLLDAFCWWLPLFYEAKLALCVYLWYPELRGAEHLYEKYFRPFVSKHEPLLDAKVDEGRALLGTLLSRGLVRAVAAVQARALAAVLALQMAAAAQAESLREQPDGLRGRSSRSLAGSSTRALRGCSSRSLGGYSLASESTRDLSASPDREGSQSPEPGGSPTGRLYSFRELGAAPGGRPVSLKDLAAVKGKGGSRREQPGLKTHPIYGKDE